MTEGDVALELAASVGQTLPAVYIEFLDGLPFRPTLGEGYSPILDFGGRQWRPYDRSRLAKPMPGRRRDVPVHYAHQTARVAADLRAGEAEMLAALADRGFSLDRLARGFCVGDDGNGEPLFLDPDTGGVFAYYHDGMDVERWAGSVAELVAGSRNLLGDEDTESWLFAG